MVVAGLWFGDMKHLVEMRGTWWLVVACHWLLVAGWLLFVVCCSLFVVRCLLFVVIG